MNDQLQQGHEGGRTPAGGGSAAKPTSATKATAQGSVSHCTMYHTARAPRKRLFRHISRAACIQAEYHVLYCHAFTKYAYIHTLTLWASSGPQGQ